MQEVNSALHFLWGKILFQPNIYIRLLIIHFFFSLFLFKRKQKNRIHLYTIQTALTFSLWLTLFQDSTVSYSEPMLSALINSHMTSSLFSLTTPTGKRKLKSFNIKMGNI